MRPPKENAPSASRVQLVPSANVPWNFPHTYLTAILLLHGGVRLALTAMSWRLRRSERALAMPWDWLARFAALHGASQ